MRDHPDRELVDYVVDGYRNGFMLGMDREPDPRPPCRNSREVERNPHIAEQLINEEIEKGHILGPFDHEPFPGQMVYSPINMVPKSNGKMRFIHDLSYPWKGTQSVNSCIPESHCSVQYHYMDEVIEMGIALGKGIFAARVDVAFAFRNQPMHISQLRFLAFSLGNKVYINSSLPFGAGSSCFIWEKIAECLQWVVSNETGCYWISHFLDDFPLLHRTSMSLTKFVHEFYKIMEHIGMPVAVEKTLGPAQIIEYLGLLLDFLNQTIGIPEKKRIKCIELIDTLLRLKSEGRHPTVKMIQKVAGSLNFICQALPAGRPFLCSIYRLTRYPTGVRRASGHHRRISTEVEDDLKMFRSFLQESAAVSVKTVPFLNKLKVFDHSIQLFADAAGGKKLACACFFMGDWRQGFWSKTSLFDNGYKPNIALLELLAMVIAVDTWAPYLAGRAIILRSDNMATEAFINRMKADIPAAMMLLRHLTKICLHFQIFVKCKYIASKMNIDSDLLSRNKMSLFFHRNPASPRWKQPLPTSLWPPKWTISQMEKYSQDHSADPVKQQMSKKRKQMDSRSRGAEPGTRSQQKASRVRRK